MGTLKDSREGLASLELDLAVEKYQFLGLFLQASVVNDFDVFRAYRRIVRRRSSLLSNEPWAFLEIDHWEVQQIAKKGQIWANFNVAFLASSSESTSP